MKRILLLMTVVVAACAPADTTATTALTTTTAATTTSTTPVASAVPRPVILDYSPTVSDVGALAFLATHPGVRLIGVTLPGTGESHCEPGVIHTRGLLLALGLGEVPVACGPEAVPWQINAFPVGWRERSDDIALPGTSPNDSRSAPELIADLVAASVMPVEIVAVGPLTNLAVALEQYPELAAGLTGITIMGGAVDVPGNVPPVEGWEHANGSAEVNFWVDPVAAARVLASGVPITLVPLDATNFLPVDPPFASALGSPPASPASRLLDTVWDHAPEWVSDGYFFWDELAAAVVVDTTLVSFETRTLVVDGEGPTAGWSHDDPAGVPIRVAVSADRGSFVQLFLETLLGHPLVVPAAAEAAYFADLEDAHIAFQLAVDEVFTATATALGFDENTDGDVWGEVLLAAVPTIIDGPMSELLARMEAMSIVSDLEMVHADYAFALRDLVSHRDEFVTELAAAFAVDDVELTIPRLELLTETCLALQDAAAVLGGWIDLTCF